VRQAICVSNEIVPEILKHAQKQPCEECCGLLAGDGRIITRAFAARNAAEEKTKNYEMAPEELFRLMREIRGAGLRLMGIYHSHPNGKNEPSARDIERAYYPEAAYLVLSPHEDAQQPVRAFMIRHGAVSELEIRVL
jgi:proteasome lid subunit RPN8/RPN11